MLHEDCLEGNELAVYMQSKVYYYYIQCVIYISPVDLFVV